VEEGQVQLQVRGQRCSRRYRWEQAPARPLVAEQAQMLWCLDENKVTRYSFELDYMSSSSIEINYDVFTRATEDISHNQNKTRATFVDYSPHPKAPMLEVERLGRFHHHLRFSGGAVHTLVRWFLFSTVRRVSIGGVHAQRSTTEGT
jgi:hypothetical protein